MRPRRRFAQHFLRPEWLADVVEAIGAGPDDTVLEVGPGRGALTLALAPRVRRLVGVEIDRDLAAALARQVPANVEIVTGDILRVDIERLVAPLVPARVVGNLPYNVSTPILFRLLRAAGQGRTITDATVMLQREVADRLTASPASKDWGVLSACVRLRARVETVLTLPPQAFRPAPKVHSAVVRITYHAPDPPVRDEAVFDDLVRTLFMWRRKMLSNAFEPCAVRRGLSSDDTLRRAGLDGHRRAETLNLAELVRLADALSAAQDACRLR